MKEEKDKLDIYLKQQLIYLKFINYPNVLNLHYFLSSS